MGMFVLKGRRQDILREIDMHPEIREVFLKVKPSTRLLAYLLNNTNLRRLYISEGIYRTIPPKVVNALRDMKVEVIVIPVKRGRPHLIDDHVIEKALSLKKKGMTMDEISSSLGVSKRTLYYRFKKKGYL